MTNRKIFKTSCHLMRTSNCAGNMGNKNKGRSIERHYTQYGVKGAYVLARENVKMCSPVPHDPKTLQPQAFSWGTLCSPLFPTVPTKEVNSATSTLSSRMSGCHTGIRVISDTDGDRTWQDSNLCACSPSRKNAYSVPPRGIGQSAIKILQLSDRRRNVVPTIER